MKTNRKNTASGTPSRPEHLSTPVETPKQETPSAEPRGLLQIDHEQRKANRSLPTDQVLDLLHRRLRHAFEFAEVVGSWVWVTFSEPQEQFVTAELSQLGFHWNSRRKVWQHPCGVFKGEPTDPRAKYQSFHPADQVAA